ncbi:hypothetical protein MNV49_004685 [Pseudohyphozyma bogoriensis]|nr:hypothetical protein MNV49_004685 [Pseudohyphozyma bogoriensis]
MTSTPLPDPTMEGCGWYECEVTQLKGVMPKCSGCRRVAYCTPEHQKLGWTLHKQFCVSATESRPPSRLSDNQAFFGSPGMEDGILRSTFVEKSGMVLGGGTTKSVQASG